MMAKVLLWHQDFLTIEQSLPSCKFFRALSSLGIAGVTSRLSAEAGYGLRLKLSAAVMSAGTGALAHRWQRS